jgi:threonine aldolase
MSGAAAGFSTAYGDGDLDRAVYEKFSEVFEREVAVFFVSTGTAANSLSLALYGKPGGISFCHREAHVMEDECGAVEYFSGGGRLLGIDGSLGRMDPAALEKALGHFFPESVHTGRPATISITQSTEIGTVYSLQDIEAISTIAGSRCLPLHMDGARFANALVALETTPAEMTWKRGIDVVSFGGTKNGCWCAEAIVPISMTACGWKTPGTPMPWPAALPKRSTQPSPRASHGSRRPTRFSPYSAMTWPPDCRPPARLSTNGRRLRGLADSLARTKKSIVSSPASPRRTRM